MKIHHYVGVWKNFCVLDKPEGVILEGTSWLRGMATIVCGTAGARFGCRRKITGGRARKRLLGGEKPQGFLKDC